MRVAYVGSALAPAQVSNHPAVSIAGNRYQVGLLRPLAKALGGVDAFLVAPMAAWPKDARLTPTRTGDDELGPGVSSRRVSFVNLPLVKQGCIAVGLLAHLSWWAMRHGRGARRVIVVYNTLSFMALPALVAARVTRSRVVVIVADVPLPQDGGSQALRRLEDELELRLIPQADALIPLTDLAGRELGRGKPYLVVEGGWWADEGDPARRPGNAESASPARVVFAGTLNAVSGIEVALESALLQGESLFELHVYGAGPLAPLVTRMAAAHPQRIVYHGRVAHHEIREAEANAAALLCPRVPDGFLTRYTFPSKLIEYLATGVPVVSNRLDGIPNSYAPLLNTPASPAPSDWHHTILHVLADEDGSVGERAVRAKRTIRDTVSWPVQAQRVAAFLQGQR